MTGERPVVPLWPPSPIEWAAMGLAEQLWWRDRLKEDHTGWLPGSCGWRAMTDAEWRELLEADE